MSDESTQKTQDSEPPQTPPSVDNLLAIHKIEKNIKPENSPEFVAYACELIANGENLRSIARKTGASRSNLCKILNLEENRGQYAQSISLRADNRFEKMDEVLDDMRVRDLGFQEARVIIDTYKWQCSKELPKRYGDKTDINMGGQVDNELKINVTFTGEKKDAV